MNSTFNGLRALFFIDYTQTNVLVAQSLYWVGLIIFLSFLFLLGLALVLLNRKKTLKFYQKLLYDDSLTETKNINYLREHFNNILVGFDQDVAMYYINIDNFKNYNDLLGHQLANVLLQTIVKRLKELVAPYDSVYRVHSDHFIVIYPSSKLNDDEFSNKMIQTLKEPYTLSVHNVKLTVSVGRYLITSRSPRFNETLLRSELALHEAKLRGKDQIVYYTSSVKRKNHDAFSTYRLIKDALRESNFFLEYQPIVDSSNGNTLALEALIRIKHKHKILYPVDIIAYAEKYHLIEDIDRYVIREAFEAYKRFKDITDKLKFMSVNISTTEIKNFSFVDYIVTEAERLDINPNEITIEFTETYLPDDFSKEAHFIKALQAHGFKVAIDDFGSGYSSMIRLSQSKLDKIKIDRSLITDIHKNIPNQKIVETVIRLADAFTMDVIVEGVETQDDLTYLQNKNIRYLQGYYFSKSLGESACVALLTKQ